MPPTEGMLSKRAYNGRRYPGAGTRPQTLIVARKWRLVNGIWLLPVFLLLLNLPTARADFEIIEGSFVTERGRLRTDAKLNLMLDKAPEEAVLSGIPLIVSPEIRLYRLHVHFWKERVANWRYRYILRYHGLSGRFILEHEASGQLETFATLIEALGSISNIRISEQLPDAIRDNDQLQARIRVRLAKDNLPAPLRLLAIFFSSWRPDSNWLQWKVAH